MAMAAAVLQCCLDSPPGFPALSDRLNKLPRKPLVRPASEAPPRAKKGKAGASTKAAPTSAATKAAKPATKPAAKPAASAGAARASAGSAHSRFGQAPQPRVQRGINAAKPLAGAAAPPAAGTHKRSSREAPTAAESVTTDETASALDLLALSQQPSQLARLHGPASLAVSVGVPRPATRRQPGSPATSPQPGLPAVSAGVSSPATSRHPARPPSAPACPCPPPAPSPARPASASACPRPPALPHLRPASVGCSMTRPPAMRNTRQLSRRPSRE
ncbi:hypothetical protein ABPG77_007957 [Micractinium sp. CCAP 211/92]